MLEEADEEVKGHNDNYYIGFFDNRQAVDLYNKLNEYASRYKNQ